MIGRTVEAGIDEILEFAADDLRRFAGCRLYVTGGTGFIGTWLLRTIARWNRRTGDNIRLDVLTRDPARFSAVAPDIGEAREIRLLAGDIKEPCFDGVYDGVLHLATPASAQLNEEQPAMMFDIIVTGARRIVDDILIPAGRVPVLFTSSGAVYGKQPADVARVTEDYSGAPNPLDVRSAYHEGKRAAELIFTMAHGRGAGIPKIARLFAFLGPGLALDAHFAAGNFIADALDGRDIVVRGDGTAYRSYLYPTDMVVWCLAVFARGAGSRAYNVGSDEAITIAELARTIASHATRPVGVVVMRRPGAGAQPERYVPDVTRITTELGVGRTISLESAIERTMLAHRDQRGKMSSWST